jgi:glucose/arabinose dehydrogenase
MRSLLLTLVLISCSSPKTPSKPAEPAPAMTPVTTEAPAVKAKKTENFSKVLGWPKGKTPIAPEGFEVIRLAENLRNPRNTYVAANGDIFVAESASLFKSQTDKIKSKKSGKTKSQNMGESANRITLLRDVNDDHKIDLRVTFLQNLKQPYGMLIWGDWFYVANTDGVYRYPYKLGQTKMTAKGEKLMDLPADGYNNHWTRNLVASEDQAKIFVSVGSSSNVGEHGLDYEKRRANILQMNPDGSEEKIFAAGLRNPVGMAIQPQTHQLWTVVNERDELGDELVPDYMTEVKEGQFYGWPFAWNVGAGPVEDPRRKGENPELVATTMAPMIPLGSHTASLGLTFYRGSDLGVKYQNGAFIGQHGSWNATQLVGYKVLFVPFIEGIFVRGPEDFLTGFVKDEAKSEVYGRPVGVTEWPRHGLLVCDDSANIIWLVRKSR